MAAQSAVFIANVGGLSPAQGKRLFTFDADGTPFLIDRSAPIAGVEAMPIPELDGGTTLDLFDIGIIDTTADMVYLTVGWQQDAELWRIGRDIGAQKLEIETFAFTAPSALSDVGTLADDAYMFINSQGVAGPGATLSRVPPSGRVETVDFRPDLDGVQPLVQGSVDADTRAFLTFGDRMYFVASTARGNSLLHYIEEDGTVAAFDTDPAVPNVQYFSASLSRSFERNGELFVEGGPNVEAIRVQADGSNTPLEVQVGNEMKPVTLPDAFSPSVELDGSLFWFQSYGLVEMTPQNEVVLVDALPDDPGVQSVNRGTLFETDGALGVYNRIENAIVRIVPGEGIKLTATVSSVGNAPYMGAEDFTTVGDTVYFTASSGDVLGEFREGVELWRLNPDGTIEQVDTDPDTPGVQTIFPGFPWSEPERLLEHDGHLYFVAESEFEGHELWVVTPNGTVRHVDFDPDTPGIQTYTPGPESSHFSDLSGDSDGIGAVIGGTLYVAPWTSGVLAPAVTPLAGVFALSAGGVAERLDFTPDGAGVSYGVLLADRHPATRPDYGALEVPLFGDGPTNPTPGTKPEPEPGPKGTKGPDRLAGSRDDEAIDGKGGNDTIGGGGGDDLLNGGGGKDKVKGGSGADTLEGGGGRDKLNGGGGADVLEGGKGRDVMTGGKGPDVFVFTRANESTRKAPDLLKKFETGVDLIDLSGMDADRDTPGDQDFTFIGRDRFSGTAGEVRFVDGELALDLDGDGRWEMAIAVDVRKGLDADDLIL